MQGRRRVVGTHSSRGCQLVVCRRANFISWIDRRPLHIWIHSGVQRCAEKWKPIFGNRWEGGVHYDKHSIGRTDSEGHW